MRKSKSPQRLTEFLESRVLLSATGTYNRTAAVAYANQYAYEVVSDGWFWVSGSSEQQFSPGSSVPSGGDDCAHFVSSCIGTPPGGTAGGLTIPSRTSSYGEPGAAGLDELLVGSSLSRYGTTYECAQLVSSVSQLQPGDVIGYDWDGSGGGSMSGIDHTAIYMGNGVVNAHSTSHSGANWTLGGAAYYFLIHITLPDTSSVNTPTNVSPANNSTINTTTPTLTASAFSETGGHPQAAAEWQIFNGATLAYDSGIDVHDLNSFTVPNGTLSANTTYTWQVRYKDNAGNWSDYSTATSFAISPPGVLSVAGADIYIRLSNDGQTVNVWNNSTAAGSPSQQVPLSQITKIIISDSSPGNTTVLDYSNGSPTPQHRITIFDSGDPSTNSLTLIGSTNGDDALAYQGTQLVLNGDTVVYGNVGSTQFIPGPGTDSLSVSYGTLKLGGSSVDSFSALTVASGASLDLGTAVVSLDYSANNNPATAMQTAIDSANFFSSAIGAGDQMAGVGLFDNGSQLILRATWKGDANCDGVVNRDDLSLIMLAQAQGQTGWSAGDFNNDQQVNQDDWVGLQYAVAYSAGRNFTDIFAAGGSPASVQEMNQMLMTS